MRVRTFLTAPPLPDVGFVLTVLVILALLPILPILAWPRPGICASGPAGEADAAPPPVAPVATLYGAAWRAEGLGQKAAGHLCWILGPGGELRVEILQVEDASLPPGPPSGDIPAALLAQSGRGWTVVLGPDDRGTWNAWGREWASADPALGPLVRFGLLELARPGDASPPGGARKVRRTVRPAAAAAVGGGPGRFRRGMVVRGLGQGGEGEILTLDRRPTRAVLTSSRRPGRVEIGLPVIRRGIAPPIPEAFTPLWALQEILENTQPGPGTPGGEER